MFILLMRHLESEKNISKNFSSNEDVELLTENGKNMGVNIATTIAHFAKKHSLHVNTIYCANSKRAKMTAELIAKKLNVKVEAFDELRSNKSGNLMGKSESDAENINPLFMKQLRLFRAGIFSSYNFVKVDDREDKKAFEQRVTSCLNSIIQRKDETLKIVILHHSSITAAIINFARQFYGYPVDFYGHVACDLGNAYLINSNDIVLCNESVERLLKVEL